jgi:hypothetical protein
MQAIFDNLLVLYTNIFDFMDVKAIFFSVSAKKAKGFKMMDKTMWKVGAYFSRHSDSENGFFNMASSV